MKTTKLLLDSPPLVVQKELAVALDSLDQALVVQQIHFLANVAEDNNNQYTFRQGHWWVYNSYSQWREDHFPFWSETKLGRIFRLLETRGLIVAKKLDSYKYDQRKWYRVDYEQLDKIIGGDMTDDAKMTQSDVSECNDQKSQNATVMSETPTETTTKRNGGTAGESLERLRQKFGTDPVMAMMKVSQQSSSASADRPSGYRDATEGEYAICKRVAELWSGGVLPWASDDIEKHLAAANQLLKLHNGDPREILRALDEYHAQNDGDVGFTVSGPYSLRNTLPRFLAKRNEQKVIRVSIT